MPFPVEIGVLRQFLTYVAILPPQPPFRGLGDQVFVTMSDFYMSHLIHVTGILVPF